MKDIFGREVNYARISITDRCNLNCIYCMPKDEKPIFAPENELLSVEDIGKICNILSNLGIDTIKITGGEPLIRKDFKEIVKEIREIDTIKKITLTTNGVFLEKYLDFLHENQVKDINLSLDSLSPQKYQSLTNFSLDKILKTIEKINNYNYFNLKINVVPINISQEEILSLVSFTQEKNIKLRFIELMPIGYGSNFEFISTDEILDIISKTYARYTKSDIKHGNGPAEYFAFDKLKIDIGFISAMSHNFCMDCNRIRITCDGKLKPCINHDYTLDIKELLNNNVDKQILSEKIKDSIYNKPHSHGFLQGIIGDKKKMYQIGG